jgi:hypothetical protein
MSGRMRGVVGVLGFLAALIATSAGLRALVPPATEYGLEAKLSYLADHRDAFDTIFLGSSRVAYGVDAVAFDARLSELGQARHSFNLGVGGMTTLEANHVLGRVLDLELPNLRTVFIEMGAWDARFYDKKNALSNRSIGWHTVDDTLDALRALPNIPHPPSKDDPSWWRLGEGATHVHAMALHLFAVGQGPRAVASLLRDAPAWRKDDWVDAEDLEQHSGFQDLRTLDDPHRIRGHRVFLEHSEQFKQLVAGIPAGNRSPISLERHFNLDALAAQIERIRAAGAEPVYFTSPSKFALPLGRALAEAGRIPAYFPFNDPDRYPDLYTIGHRNDADHLNGKGAAILGRLLAQAFAERDTSARTQD